LDSHKLVREEVLLLLAAAQGRAMAPLKPRNDLAIEDPAPKLLILRNLKMFYVKQFGVRRDGAKFGRNFAKCKRDCFT
jgi:hypothetical protein